MKLKPYLMNSPFFDVVEEVKLAGEFGFAGVEFAIEYPKATCEALEARMQEILDELSRYGLARRAHAQMFVDVCHVYSSLREASVREIKRALEIARKLEADFVTIHPGYASTALEREEMLRILRPSLREILKAAESNGLEVGVENLHGTHFNKVETFKLLFDDPEFAALSAHAFDHLPRGYGWLRQWEWV